MIKLLAAPVVAIAVFAVGDVTHAGEWNIDSNGDGYQEGFGVDRWGDGTADLEAYDVSGNGIWDTYFFDINNDGVHDVRGWDANENNVMETMHVDVDVSGTFDVEYVDVNENMVADVLECSVDIYTAIQGATVVGPPTSPGGFYGLMTSLAGVSGSATFGTPDLDGDGWYANDYFPLDPAYH